MKKLLLLIITILSLVQIIIVLSINVLEKEFINLLLVVIHNKIQHDIDEKVKIGSSAEVIKNVIEKEFNQIQVVGISPFNYNEEIVFDWVKLIRNKKYPAQYFHYYLSKSLYSLKRDLNIIFGTNIITLFLLFIVAYKSYHNKIGQKLSWVILISVICSTSFYFFSQNWLFTILLNNYYGFSYLIIFSIISLIMMDIAFNKGKVVSHLFSEMTSIHLS